MGNGSSELQAQPISPSLLRGDILIDKTFMHDVTVHHTTQHAYSKFRIIKFTHVDRESESQLKLKNRLSLQFCREKHFQLNDLLKSACLPSKCRHPTVLCIHRFLLDPANSCLFLIAEPSLPLSMLITNCDVHDLLLGTRSILSALDFVHRSLSVSHNNLRLSSLFVTAESQWKLGGFEFSLPFKQMDKEVTELLELLLHDGENLRTAAAYNRNYPYCYDIYAFSRLISQLVTKCLGSDCEVFSSFIQVLHKSCMHPQPKVRLPPHQLLAHPIFRHPLLVATEFLESYMTHTDEEKTEFFNTFRDKIAHHLSPELLCKKLIPKCLDSTIFLDPPSQVFVAQLLKPYPDSDPAPADHGLLTYSSFQRYACPLVLGKFRLRERLTRLILLQHFTGYAHLLRLSELQDTVLPEVCLGVFDLNDPLSSWSLRALGDLSTRLGATVTLNALREVEGRLKRENKLTSVTSKSHVGEWPRGSLFSEAAPKINRMQREIPLSEKRSLSGANGTGLSLAQLASLAADYNPDSNPQLMFANDDDDECSHGVSTQPISLKGNARKVKPLNRERPARQINSIPCHLTLTMSNTLDVSDEDGSVHLEINGEPDRIDTSPKALVSAASENTSQRLRSETVDSFVEDQQIEQLLTEMEPKLVVNSIHSPIVPAEAPLKNCESDVTKNQANSAMPTVNRLTICDTVAGNHLTVQEDGNEDEIDAGDGWDEAWDSVVE